MRQSCLSIPLFVVVIAMTGCGSGLPRVYPVKGTIVNKGKGSVKDLAGYSVQFESTSEPGERPGGPIDENGGFTLYTLFKGKAIPGVKEGTYRACVVPPPPEAGSAPPLVIPARYTKCDTAKLQFEVKPGENNFTIEIDRGR